MKLSNNSKGLIYISFTAFLWGALAVVIKIALNYFTPKTVAWSRFFVAFITLLILQLIRNKKSIRIFAKPPLLLIVSSICLALNYVLFMEGLKITTPNNAVVFIQSGPLLLALSGFLFFKEKFKPGHMIGFTTATIGFYLFYHDQLNALFTSSEQYNKGILLILIAGALWTLYSIIQKKLLVKYPADTLNLVNFGIPAILLIPGIHYASLYTAPWFAYLILLGLGLSTLIAYHLLSLALKFTEANKISIIITTNPTISFIIMAIFAKANITLIEKETITFNTIMGAILVISGAIVVSLTKTKPVKT